MRVDSNTRGHRQWFYFSLKNTQKCKIKLHIHRFRKIYSLFQRGMKPYVRSRKSGKDWAPGGSNVTYHYQFQRNYYGVRKRLKTSILTFTYRFQAQNDEVLIAAGIPYTYSFLQTRLLQHKKIFQTSQNIQISINTLCKTLCGIPVQLVTIQHRMSKLHNKQKRFIIINARTHPGQTSSSWVLDGFLQAFSSTNIQEMMLRQNICFKIVPMLNPDGVFIGNYRTGIIGEDFNRRFSSGKKELFPEIFAIKKMVAQCCGEGKVQLFLDLHGHSILKNSFIFGPQRGHFQKNKLRNIAYYLNHNSKYFKLSSCRFKTQDTVIETARSYFQNKQKILSLTCQSSLGLYDGLTGAVQMVKEDWQAFGKDIMKAIVNIYSGILVEIPGTIIKTQPKPQKLMFQQQKMTKKNASKHIGDLLRKQQLQIQNSAKINFKIPSFHLRDQGKKHQLAPSIYQTISNFKKCNIQVHPKTTTQAEMTQQSKLSFKIRKKSELTKRAANKFMQKLTDINKKQQEQQQAQGEGEFGAFQKMRSVTYGTPSDLSEQIQKMNRNQSGSIYDQMQIQPIKQNFSQNYSSINDSDTSSQDLAPAQKQYLYDYLKAGQVTYQDREETKQEKIKSKSLSREPRISGFREVRFKSIEQQDLSEKIEGKIEGRGMAKRIKMQPHKFKTTVSRSFLDSNEDCIVIPISQQKRLNQRIGQGQTQQRVQKEPFVLLKRKISFQQ